MPIWIKIIYKILFWVLACGIGSNYIMRYISYSFYKRAKRCNRVEEAIRRIEIDDSLIGYVKNMDSREKKKIILYFGGSGEISYNAVLNYGNLFNDYIFACVDYKGTQESKGRMNLKTMQESSLQLYDCMVRQGCADISRIIVMGYSYGAGIATYLASKRTCSKLVLIAAYRDNCDLYNRFVPIFWGPLKIFITDNIDAKTYAANVHAETLLITSDGDKSINKKIPYRLLKYFKNAIIKEFKGIAHLEYLKHDNVVAYIHEFLGN